MLLGFKRRFAPFVEDGSKRHSIRGGDRWEAGMRCDCYVDPRQRTMRLLGRWPCVRVRPIEIVILQMADWIRLKGGLVITAGVIIAGEPLGLDECNSLAYRDGFRTGGEQTHGLNFVEMLSFWQGRLPFEGQIIHWDYDSPVRRRA